MLCINKKQNILQRYYIYFEIMIFQLNTPFTFIFQIIAGSFKIWNEINEKKNRKKNPVQS